MANRGRRLDPKIRCRRCSLSINIQDWKDAKKKYRLSDAHIQMARELGMNPKKFGSLANHKQEKWKAPLPDFIEELYYKRFRKEKPDVIVKLK
jgi:hypothetical protein